ncbi:MAG: phosphoribosylanthranilate isomerase [Bryobacteraceae bacterium]
MIVKICGITNRDDARAAAESGATALGFNFFAKSPRYIDPSLVPEILEVVPVSIWKIGVFVHETTPNALAIAARAGLDILQVIGEDDQFPPGTRVWKTVRVEAGFEAEKLDARGAEAFLLDAPSATLCGGTGHSFDWKLARGVLGKVVLAGGLDETNVRRAIEEARPWGVDACSRLESAPGRKDHRKMALFLKAALS